ncbi:MAG TPA: arginase family protein [Alphaproteobacteria bacterium]|nr:arginase family protein [Alphaproteobacteria bacterium]
MAKRGGKRITAATGGYSPKHRVDRPFVGIPSFLRSSICTDLDALDAAIAIMGVPFDEGSPFLAGSRMGPRALREHSLRFGSANKGFYDPETDKQYLEYEMANGLIADTGDADILPTNVEKTFEIVTDMTRRILDRGAMPVVLGGDHSITYPVVRAFDTPLHVVHFDAHTDYAPFIHDLRFTNQHPFRHISPMKHVLSLTQVGIRSLREGREYSGDSIRDGNRVITMSQFHRLKPNGIAEIVPANAPCYVSIDVDVMDISLVPGCVSAEPNGMTYSELRDTLKAIAKRADVIGFDFVEVNPQLDVGTGITSYLGVHTVIEFLGHICDQPRWIAKRTRWRQGKKRRR